MAFEDDRIPIQRLKFSFIYSLLLGTKLFINVHSFSLIGLLIST